MVAPREGGETHFADLTGAYASMPKDLRARIDGVSAVYSAEPRPEVRQTPLNAEERARIRDPLIRTHPYSKRKAVYLSPMYISDLSAQDSRRLIDELCAHAALPAHPYRHKWTVGDVVIWDNAAVMHRRTSFAPTEPRHLKRTGFYFPDEFAIPF